MNRLKNYISSRQLAEQYLNSAEASRVKITDVMYAQALSYLIHAMRYMITANNNLQSLAFQVKPKRRKP